MQLYGYTDNTLHVCNEWETKDWSMSWQVPRLMNETTGEGMDEWICE